jgi:two-component system cell cycle response regulator
MAKILVAAKDLSLQEKIVKGLAQEECVWNVTDQVNQPQIAINESNPDLILLGNQSVGVRGIKRIKEWANEPLSRDLPLIVVGSFEQDDDWIRALNAGAIDYVNLPLNPEALWAKTKNQLRLKGRQDQLQTQAIIDELTGVYNRRYLENQLSLKFAEAKRYGYPFAFLIFDIDHFKKVNDKLGHPFGDFVLQEMPRIVQGEIRQEDTIADMAEKSLL